MHPFDHHHQAPKPVWSQTVDSSSDNTADLIGRIRDLEQQIETYEALLEDLPDLFERKFQQRLEPLIERYRLLAEQSEATGHGTPALLKSTSSKGNVVRFPRFRLPTFLQSRQRSA